MELWCHDDGNPGQWPETDCHQVDRVLSLWYSSPLCFNCHLITMIWENRKKNAFGKDLLKQWYGARKLYGR
jgi:hypothetical protein